MGLEKQFGAMVLSDLECGKTVNDMDTVRILCYIDHAYVDVRKDRDG